MTWETQSKELALLLNSLVLSAIVKGAQSQYDVPIEDRVTDADLERYESKIMALAAALASPPASDPPGLVALARETRDIVDGYDDQLPSVKVAQGTPFAVAVGLMRRWLLAYPLPASPQAK